MSEVCCRVVPTSRDLSPDRLAIGQLLGRLLREFRTELFSPAGEHGYADLREPHLQIFGNVGIDGVRLTELAARSLLSLATTSELVSDLQRLGYLERRPDPVDRRAKLIFPTTRGRQARRRQPSRRNRTALAGSPRRATLGRYVQVHAGLAGFPALAGRQTEGLIGTSPVLVHRLRTNDSQRSLLRRGKESSCPDSEGTAW